MVVNGESLRDGHVEKLEVVGTTDLSRAISTRLCEGCVCVGGGGGGGVSLAYQLYPVVKVTSV